MTGSSGGGGGGGGEAVVADHVALIISDDHGAKDAELQQMEFELVLPLRFFVSIIIVQTNRWQNRIIYRFVLLKISCTNINIFQSQEDECLEADYDATDSSFSAPQILEQRDRLMAALPSYSFGFLDTTNCLAALGWCGEAGMIV